ncbi:MAG: metallophosphoesterase [Clostridia bacterium]|nr:metallophosphoesterase [Clostridia bacterium]
MMLNPHETHLHFGLEKPIRILHLTDVHIALTYEEEGEMLNALSNRRRDVFFREANFPERDPVGYLEEAMEYSKNFDCTVITGDVLDLVFEKSKDVVKKILAGKDYMFCAGNHEYCKRGTPETFQSQPLLRKEVQPCFRGNMTFESRIVGGVNIIAADNGFVMWDKKMLPLLKAEVAKGLPILLFCHCPLTDPMRSLEYDHDKLIAAGATEEEIAASVEIINYIAEEPLFKAFFAGHGHFTTTFSLNGKPSHMLGGLFKGIVGEIVID